MVCTECKVIQICCSESQNNYNNIQTLIEEEQEEKVVGNALWHSMVFLGGLSECNIFKGIVVLIFLEICNKKKSKQKACGTFKAERFVFV